MILWFLLDLQGIQSQLRIGVKRELDQFTAHAWVEWNNMPLKNSLAVCREFTMFDKLQVF